MCRSTVKPCGAKCPALRSPPDKTAGHEPSILGAYRHAEAKIAPECLHHEASGVIETYTYGAEASNWTGGLVSITGGWKMYIWRKLDFQRGPRR